METNLDARIAEAKAAGTSYGKLMAENYDPDAVEEAPEEKAPIGTSVCAQCGKEFPIYNKYPHKYCSDECRKAATKERLEANKTGVAIVETESPGITDREKVLIASMILQNGMYQGAEAESYAATIASAIGVLRFGEERA